MQADESIQPSDDAGRSASARFLKKQLPEREQVTAQSIALFRFGEQCNNHCPMCSNTGEMGLFFHSTAELQRRADFLHASGFRRVVVTGGEATIHPGFWEIIERLQAHDMLWDTNTHGRTFAHAGFSRRAVDSGLRRAIVSLHSHRPEPSAAIFGASLLAHDETVAGIDSLLSVGVEVMLNCVLTRLNLDHLEEYLGWGHARYGRQVAFKFVFPNTLGKGGQWPAIASLRYDEVRDAVQRLWAAAGELDVRVHFESFPSCILRDPDAVNMSRSQFGESHYLDDATGDTVYSMRHIEAELSAFGEACRDCTALRRCAGVALAYATRYGVDELRPFTAQS